jgi:hypothetical protein
LCDATILKNKGRGDLKKRLGNKRKIIILRVVRVREDEMQVKESKAIFVMKMEVRGGWKISKAKQQPSY